jgi:nicotinate-nucleotide adenylyltransferase
MTRPDRLGLLGGTFDPIHVGHVAAAEAVCRTLGLDEVWLLTSRLPPHRPQPEASVHHRFAMVALAVQDHPAMRASDLELQSPGPSYTSATLARLQSAGFRPSQLFFIVGADAFAEIATWMDYPDFLDAANFVVVSRGQQPPGADALAEPPVASRLRRAEGTRVFSIDQSTPDVSSTAIRERCARGEPIAGLVAPAVERHIARHALYARGSARRGTSSEHLTTSLLHEQEHL